MNTTPPTDRTPPPGADTVRPGFFGAVRRTGLARTDDRWIGGVCAGLAHRFGLDPLLVRGLLGVTVLLGGFGLVIYGLGWALLPEARDGRIHLEELLAGRFDVAVLGAIGFVLVGIGRGDSWATPWHVPAAVQGLGWLVLLGLVIALVVLAAQQSGGQLRPPTRYGPFPTGPTGAVPPSYPTPAPGPYGPFPDASATSPAATATMWASSAAAPPPAPADGATDGSAGGTGDGATQDGSTTTPGTVPTADETPTAATGTWAAEQPTAPWAPGVGPAVGATRWQPPVAPAPRRRGPGRATTGVVVALSLLTFAGLLLAERSGHLTASVALIGAGATVVWAGLGILVSGLRGRRGGGLSALAILVLLVAWPVSASNGWTSGTSTVDQRVRITDVTAAEKGVHVGFGDTVVDLSDLRLRGGTHDVPVDLGAGDLTILLPRGVAVDATATVGVGSVQWDAGDQQGRTSGVGLNRTFETSGTGGTIRLDVTLGTGDLTIEQEAGR
ncbi:MAG: PspC domain-containing protein [Actinobacteria bacterium]|nr:PspC domain-containing protein [Actinomycetota bacterium]